jgi:hypothetical protein
MQGNFKMNKTQSGILFFVLLAFKSNAASCPIKDVTPQSGDALTVLNKQIKLGQFEDGKPKIWEGPIKINEEGWTRCAFGLDIIESPLTLVANRYLYIPTYSGDARTLTIIDISQCRIAWQSPVYSGEYAVKSDGFYLKGRKLKLGDSCVPPYDIDNVIK